MKIPFEKTVVLVATLLVLGVILLNQSMASVTVRNTSKTEHTVRINGERITLAPGGSYTDWDLAPDRQEIWCWSGTNWQACL